jgi:hypothetical protein
LIFVADNLNDIELASALDICLTPAARHAAAQCTSRARAHVTEIHADFVSALSRRAVR